MKRFLILGMAAALLLAAGCGAKDAPVDDVPPIEGTSQESDAKDEQKIVYIPAWMENYSVVYYDEDLNRTIERGGDLTEEEIAGREDIDPEQMYGTLIAEPNTKVEYDLHGFIQNIYYLNEDGEYQLEKPHDMVG